jgi:hypothetical protein
LPVLLIRRFWPRPIHPIDDEDVKPAIGVIVEKGATGAERFREILLAERAVVVNESDASLLGDVGQMKAGAGKSPGTQKGRRG